MLKYKINRIIVIVKQQSHAIVIVPTIAQPYTTYTHAHAHTHTHTQTHTHSTYTHTFFFTATNTMLFAHTFPLH